MPKTAMYFHGGSANHGCEAIVRSTAKLLGEKLVLYSSGVEEDYQYNVDEIVSVYEDIPKALKKGSLVQIRASLSQKLHKDDYLFTYKMHERFFDAVEKRDIYLSVGGDNYCYKGQDILEYYNRGIHKKGAKTVLWGCSINSDELTQRIQKDLAQYDLITARESISYNVLKSINPNTVLIPDTAFCLDVEDVPLPEGFQPDNLIGINLSPLILQYGNREIIIENYRKLIKHILTDTDYNIVLIPHVVKCGNDDRTVLTDLLEKSGNPDRVKLISDQNCMRLKSVIGKCRFFIGARTHATIAAYSQNVPTLVTGYSTKSVGIARDLFGTEEHFVIPVKDFESENDMVREFDWLQTNEQTIKSCLRQKIPEYSQELQKIRHIFADMI